jgi:hypothetical protein
MNNILDLAKKFKQDIADISSEYVQIEITIRELPIKVVNETAPDIKAETYTSALVTNIYKTVREKNLSIELNSIYE